jgi:hypothetical protein
MRLCADSTPLEKFGIKVTVFDHPDHGRTLRLMQTEPSEATYLDGKTRKWQGASLFHWPFRSAFPESRRLDDEALKHCLERMQNQPAR